MKADLTATARCSSLHLSSPLEHDAAGEAGSLNWSSTCATAHQGGSHGRSPPRLALGSSSIARQLLPHARRAHSRVSCSRRAWSPLGDLAKTSGRVKLCALPETARRRVVPDVSLSRRLASTQCFRRRRATSACARLAVRSLLIFLAQFAAPSWPRHARRPS